MGCYLADDVTPINHEAMPETMPDEFIERPSLPLAGLYWWIKHNDSDGGWSTGQCDDIVRWFDLIWSVITKKSEVDYYTNVRRIFMLAVTHKSIVLCA